MSLDVGVGKEAIESERPALKQLVSMGYEYRTKSEINQSRRKYNEVLLYDRLEKAIRRLNPDLDKEGIQSAISQIEEDKYPYSCQPVDANEQIWSKITSLSQTGGREPIVVEQSKGGRSDQKIVKIFDFENINNNDYLVTNQFKLQGFRNSIVLDIVVFVNGIPLVIIECKDPTIPRPIEQAYEKNFSRYQNPGQGFEKLFFYNHCMIATCGTLARIGALQSNINHYARWGDSYPITKEDVKIMGDGRTREQEILIAGILSKQTLLNHLQNFVIYETVNHKKIKKLAKYQQYRVVTKSISRLLKEDNIKDQGGVIWHTQGSGKSLSMLWLAFQLRNKLNNPPILIVTDRKQLDRQIYNTFKRCGFPTHTKAKNAKDLKELLLNPRGKTIMTGIKKFLERSDIYTEEKIICLVDEAHRTQFRITAQRMRVAMPNAVFFGFTGTPIDEPNRSTYRVFGPMLDEYGFKESQVDGTTLPINYEGRLPELFIEGEDTIDQMFERIIAQDSSITPDMKKDLQKRCVTRESIAEAPSRIRRIAADIVEHYTTQIEPNGYKAMIVTSSRDAAVLYKRELDALKAPNSRIIMTSELGEIGKDEQNWDEYYLSSREAEQKSEEFKSADDPTKILIVVDMLLVGYDVPICQVLYLDKNLKKHNLLQAIARVNRNYDESKTCGFIVDYSGITVDLQKAFEEFDSHDIDGALYPISDMLNKLHNRHRKVMEYFNGVDKNNYDDIIEKFNFINIREEFEYDMKMFAIALDIVLPSRKAELYVADFKFSSAIRQLVRTWYGDGKPSLKPYTKKIQQLINEHIRSSSITVIIDNQEITHKNFLKSISKYIKNDRAKASVIKARAIAVIDELSSNNPTFYEKLREQLRRLIDEEKERRITNINYCHPPESYAKIYTEAISEENSRKEVFGDYDAISFEFALYGELCKVKSKKESIDITKEVYSNIKSETYLLEWKIRQDVEKKIRELVYEILKKANFDDDNIDRLSDVILTLAVNNI